MAKRKGSGAYTVHSGSTGKRISKPVTRKIAMEIAKQFGGSVYKGTKRINPGAMIRGWVKARAVKIVRNKRGQAVAVRIKT